MNKQLSSSTNSKQVQVVNLTKSGKNINTNNNGTIFMQDKLKVPQNQTPTVSTVVSPPSKTQTHINSLRNDLSTAPTQKQASQNLSNNLNNIGIAKETSTSKLLKEIKEKSKIVIGNSAKKEGSVEKLMKISFGNSFLSTAQQKFMQSSVSPPGNSKFECSAESDAKIPSLKSSSKPKTKILSTVKDVKINLVPTTKGKVQNSFLIGNFSNVTSAEKAVSESPVVVNYSSNFNKERPTVKNHIPNPTETDTEELYVAENDDVFSTPADGNELKNILSAASSYIDTENNKSSKRKTNINITNNYNSNINVNTFTPPINSIYNELSRKLIKQTTPKSGYYVEDSELLNSALNTEERSSRKKPNYNILESENPEDLHFIQVEMLLQSKLISRKFESSDAEKSPKISPSKLPVQSVIPLDEIDL